LKIETYLKTRAKEVDRSLDRLLPKAKEPPALIHEAMRYGTLGAGKRIRPILTLAVSDVLGGSKARALFPACAIECIHSYSLIHDDLPSMDNDDMRRGRPTCHKKFGEAYAILAGDGLLTEAFYLLGQFPDAKKSRLMVQVLGRAVGSQGMVGGQVVDKIFETKKIDQGMLDFVHMNKTGKLITAACQLGAISAGATKSQLSHIRKYGEYIGFAFQIVDDIMDKDGYLQFMSAGSAREEAALLTQKAQKELSGFGKKAEILLKIAEFLGSRVK